MIQEIPIRCWTNYMLMKRKYETAQLTAAVRYLWVYGLLWCLLPFVLVGFGLSLNVVYMGLTALNILGKLDTGIVDPNVVGFLVMQS